LPLLSFAAITDDPPAEVSAAGHDRMIINIKPENLDAWLQPQGKSLEEMQTILGDRQAPYYEHEVMAA
jgi:putative SOS response-associated peptidase YedK